MNMEPNINTLYHMYSYFHKALSCNFYWKRFIIVKSYFKIYFLSQSEMFSLWKYCFSLYFSCIYANIYLVLEIFYGNYNSLYLYFLYKGIYNFEAVFLMESRIRSLCVLPCSEIIWNPLREETYLIKNKNKQKQNCTNAQPEADN